MSGVLKSIVIGAAAGLFAAYVMEEAQAVLSKAGLDSGGEGDPSTVRAADRIAVHIGGGPVPDAWREQAGRWVHYATGAGLGVLFSVGSKVTGIAGTGVGLAYGALTSLLLDETAVPALKLGPPPSRTPPQAHLYSMLTHLAFGAALKGAHRTLARAF